MSVEDYRINAYVRQVLSRCWVDLRSLRFGAVGRIVYFHGRFEKVRGPRDEADGRRGGAEIAEDIALLVQLEKEIRRDAVVTDVVFRLDNFRKVHGAWTIVGAG
ncbi:MAG: hypothetical protein ACRDGR_02860 [bacterium]